MRLARALLALLCVSIVLGLGLALGITALAGGGTSGYLVRAVFDNSSFVIPGEDVKVAGVKVGTIQAVDLTQQNKAAVVLRIDDRQFRPFRADAHCEIGIESLLGEQFVQCTPTLPRAPGQPPAPPLPTIASGPNQGQHILPVQNTTAPIGFDLLQNIQRLPEQERFQLIINGLGAGLAGNGQELNAALKRADPALQETDRVIAVLARQDRLLASLVDDSSRVLAPLAAQRAHLGGFIRHAGAVAVASAQEGPAIEQNLRDFPPFLNQLRPATARLSNLADQMTPALQELQAQTPAINASVRGLGPLAKTSIPSFLTLGAVARRGEQAFPKLEPIARQLLRLGRPLKPLALDLAAIAQSFDNSGGIEDVMRFIYYYAGAVNGEDAFGHYIRSHVVINGEARTSHLVQSESATFACATGSSGCGRKLPAGSAANPATAATPASSTARSSTAKDASTAALLHYLLAP